MDYNLFYFNYIPPQPSDLLWMPLYIIFEAETEGKQIQKKTQNRIRS